MFTGYIENTGPRNGVLYDLAGSVAHVPPPFNVIIADILVSTVPVPAKSTLPVGPQVTFDVLVTNEQVEQVVLKLRKAHHLKFTATYKANSGLFGRMRGDKARRVFPTDPIAARLEAWNRATLKDLVVTGPDAAP